MKKLTQSLLLSSLVFGCLGTIAAQEKSEGMHQPPKVLNVLREYTKPGKNGMSHEKTEAAFVQAMTAAKFPTHYLAVDSLSGKPRTLFLTAYDSFEAMEKDIKAVEKNASLLAALDHAGVVDGELLSDTDSSDLAYREDLSLRGGDVAKKLEETGERITETLTSRSATVTDTLRESVEQFVDTVATRVECEDT